MKQIERIEKMEQYLDESEAAIQALSEAMDRYEAIQPSLRKLSDYYGSTRWMKDFEDDEAGKLPEDLKRGVLSEDAVYNLLTDHHELILRMSKAITKSIDGKMI
jgi:DNA-directed RNA polymerase sigma subunit (sigma70/sigma32)